MLIIVTSFINPVYCKYTDRHTRYVTINVRKPNYKVVFNKNAPSGTTVTGTMNDQSFIYGVRQNLTSNSYALTNYDFLSWNTSANGSGTVYTDGQEVLNITSVDNATINLYAMWGYMATPVITRSDYNTFTYTAPGAHAYYVSKSSTRPSGSTSISNNFALNTWTSATNTGDLSLASGDIYYVFAEDADGNVSAGSANIAVRTVTRSQGTGTTLTTKYESSSGGAFTTSPTYVLNGTPIYVSAALNTGYQTLVLNKNDAAATNNTTHTINTDTTFASSSTIITYTISYTLNSGSATNPTSYNVTTANFTLNNPTRSGYTFLGWSGTGLTGTTNKTVTITKGSTGNRSYTANWLQNPIINGVTTATMSQATAATYYGKTVKTVAGTSFNPNASDTRTWQVFYIDTANKYGDGKGTIYLKAKSDSTKTIRFNSKISGTGDDSFDSVFADNTTARTINGTSTTSYVTIKIGSTTTYKAVGKNRYYKISGNNVVNSSGDVINTKYLSLNPKYKTGRVSYNSSYPSKVNFFNMEKAAAFLCDPAQFTAYKDSRVNYATGSPSVEMYIDSWNSKYTTKTMNYRFNTKVDGTTDRNKLPGYQLYPEDDNGTAVWGTVTGKVNIPSTDTTGMYKTSSGLWIASPSVIYHGGSLIRLSTSASVGLGNATINQTFEFTPVVALNPEAIVITTDYTG